MWPEVVSLDLPWVGRLTITSFGLMMVAAFLGGNLVMRKRLTELGRPSGFADDVMIRALVGGLVGAKLYYVALYAGLEGADPLALLLSRQGLVWYGGLIGGTAAVVWLAWRREGVTVPFAADLVAPALALGYGLGRIGCFLVGDDYGRPTGSWVGVAFPGGSPPSTAGNLRRHFDTAVPEGVPDSAVLEVFPTQLFEAAAAFVIFWLLWRLRRNPHRDGWLFGVWMIAAGLERMGIEFFRAKDDRFFGPLTLAQLLSLLLVAGGVYLWWRRRAPAGPSTRGAERVTAEPEPRTADA